MSGRGRMESGAKEHFSIVDTLSGTTWWKVLAGDLESQYVRELERRLEEDWSAGITVFPEKHAILRALELTRWPDIRVVVIGQDPYHGEGQANGLAFAVNPGVRLPPSVKNIFKELNADTGIPTPNSATFVGWARQGVLMLNSVLTVRAHEPLSHAGIGWERFTENIVRRLNDHPEALVFMLWGASAQKKSQWIASSRHLVLEAAHPSPLSAHRGFFGCRHFSKANEFLREQGRPVIDWGDVNSTQS